jgi:FkbM family methyltransferase
MKPVKESFGKNIASGIFKKLNNSFFNPYRKININWFYIKYLKHLPGSKRYSHKLFGHKTFFTSGHEYLHGLTEIFVDEIYKQQLPENATIIDCGANIGLSVIYFKKEFPSCRVVAFEPDGKNFELLKNNIQSHDLKDVELLKKAVWIENTQLKFSESGNMGSKIGGDNNTVKVDAVRLKDFLSANVDFLKIDIEGAEYEVLKDIEANLYQVNKMFLEYHGKFSEGYQLTEIISILQKAGFEYYIKEATQVYLHPFKAEGVKPYDVQLNIFCFRNKKG